MPLQNRALPDGTLVKTPHRGTLMGNRGGRIHDPHSRRLLSRRWVGKRWICCELAFKNRHRTVMGDSYTELFFLDEVTALAAGHRPCFECRNMDARRFADCWNSKFPLKRGSVADQMDQRLHRERIEGNRRHGAIGMDAMREGVIYRAGDRFYTRRADQRLEWRLSGYLRAGPLGGDEKLQQVTPPAIAAVLDAGYRPRWHPTSGR